MDGRGLRRLVGVLLLCLHGKLLWAADLDQLNASLSGQVLDLTHNHGRDNRVWSPTLSLYRDLYVYLPPHYDLHKPYPLFLWIHGFGGDEEQFTRQVVRALDQAIVSGAMPPLIAVCPDVSVPCKWKPWCQGSWCINSRQGSWEDYVVHDVLDYMKSHFNIRPEREAHAIAGWSMGGFASYNIGFKHPDEFRLLVGIYPNLNIRYCDKAGHWGSPFKPDTIGRLEELRWGHWLGRYPKPWRFPVNAGVVYWPAWGSGKEAIQRMSQENPYELIDRLDIQDGQFDLFIAYGRQDEYHVDSQVDSFLHRARERHVNVWVRYNPDGHHSTEFVNECMPDVLVAVGERLRQLQPDLANQARADRVAGSRDNPEAPAGHLQRVPSATESLAAHFDAVLIPPPSTREH